MPELAAKIGHERRDEQFLPTTSDNYLLALTPTPFNPKTNRKEQHFFEVSPLRCISQLPGLNPDWGINRRADRKLFRHYRSPSESSDFQRMSKDNGSHKDLLHYQQVNDIPKLQDCPVPRGNRGPSSYCSSLSSPTTPQSTATTPSSTASSVIADTPSIDGDSPSNPASDVDTVFRVAHVVSEEQHRQMSPLRLQKPRLRHSPPKTPSLLHHFEHIPSANRINPLQGVKENINSPDRSFTPKKLLQSQRERTDIVPVDTKSKVYYTFDKENGSCTKFIATSPRRFKFGK